MMLPEPPFWIPWQPQDDYLGQLKCCQTATTQKRQVIREISSGAIQLMSYRHPLAHAREGSANQQTLNLTFANIWSGWLRQQFGLIDHFSKKVEGTDYYLSGLT